MRKIPSLFCRNYEGDRQVRDEVVPGSEWVSVGEGKATRKFDGTPCMVRDGKLYRRYDVKKGCIAPPGFEACQVPDEVTGHQPGWIPVGDGPDSVWFREAFDGQTDGTYELCGPKVNGNPERFSVHVLVRHGALVVDNCPRDFAGIRAFLAKTPIEGIVWHHPDGRMVKIKRRDFGLPWPIPTVNG